MRALGYTAREAAFLTRVARHGGYFLRRQFLEWIGRHHGQTVVDFTARLVARRHATVQTFCRSTHVYHLSARALFEGLEAGPSLRRRRPATSIKARLMALDLIASRPDVTFLATEAERVAWCDVMGVPRDRLPQQRLRVGATGDRVRYFPDGSLMGALQTASGPVLVCAYLDDGAQSPKGFQSYLRRYASLVASVPQVRLIHGSDDGRTANGALALLRQAFGLAIVTGPHAPPSRPGDVREYFQLRRAYERQHWAVLDTAKLDRLRELRRQFGIALEALYARWECLGDDIWANAPRPLFEAVVLPHSYAAIEVRTRRS